MTRLFIFISIVTCVSVGLHLVVWKRLFHRDIVGFKTRKISFFVLLSLGILSPVLYGLFRVATWIGPISTFFVTWSGVVFLLTAVLLCFDLLFLIFEKSQKFNSQRRLFFRRGFSYGAVATAGSLTTYGVSEVFNLPRVKDVEVPIVKWPKELDGFRIVQISDLHVGPTLKRKYVEGVVHSINGLEPDLVLLTGDLVDGSVEMLRNFVEPLKDIKSKFGVYFSLGNHEYYSGVLQWMEHFQSLGLKLLRNEHTVIKTPRGDFVLAGVDDFHAKRVMPEHGYDLQKALENRPPELPVILMAHQPLGIYEAVDSGVDLQLSGHTHGGQIWPFFLFVSLVQPFVRGLHRVKDSHIYVSCGTGFWGPALRVGTKSEITQISIRANS